MFSPLLFKIEKLQKILMKKIFTKLSSISIMVTFTLIFNACNNQNKEEENRNVSTSFSIPALLERDKNLSYDEFLKIQEKFNKLTKEYKEDDTKADNLVKLAEIYIFEARVTGEHPYYYNAALKTIDELLAKDKKLTLDQKFIGLFYKSTVQLSQHKFKDALQTGKQALELSSQNAGIYGVLVDANVEIGNYEEAVASCDKMMSIRPDLRSYSRTSYLREIYGDIKGSKESMEMAIEAGAPFSEYKCWTIVTMGRMLENHNQIDSAYAYYNFALNERPNYPFAVAGLARLAGKEGDYKKSDSLFTVALDAIPEIGFTIDQALTYKQRGNTQKVNELIKEIEKMFKEDMESGHNVRLEYAMFINEFKKDYDQALKLGLEEYQTRKNNIDVNRLLAMTYYLKNDISSAKKHLAIAMRTNIKDAELYCLAGLINNDKAILKKSFEIDPFQNHFLVKKAKEMM